MNHTNKIRYGLWEQTCQRDNYFIFLCLNPVYKKEPLEEVSDNTRGATNLHKRLKSYDIKSGGDYFMLLCKEERKQRIVYLP